MKSLRLAMAAAVLLIAGCHPSGQTPQAANNKPSVDHGWVRLSAVPGQPSAAYFTLHGGDTLIALDSVSAPGVGSAMIHATQSKGAMSEMTMLDKIDLPAHGLVTLAPGGMHVMLMDVTPALTSGTTLRMTLHFHGGEVLTTDAKVIAAGDPEPKF
ncbi:MAG: copper chaperone PCu(A)C [Alphaproteobacteria bacterium]|nr:copper chaperone PCu(A)C [Alphaproteobacteria bacterium]MDE2043118.1 copper chaperone PCu(A)C [Alphaproteobacteria bacterium]MDE2339578.1 copper chaperone PCu(A)C [Alphaproteobacteria bacterium]